MALEVHAKIDGLDSLESGLKVLKRSKLFVVREFKDMLVAAERHYSDMKFAHLTGKAKDRVDQAERDTKFYNILVRMLCEVKEQRSGEQRHELKKVYTWYLANKHVLYSGPHFGREFLKREAKEVLIKASSPRVSQRYQSSNLHASLNNHTQNASSHLRRSTVSRQETLFDWRKELNEGCLFQDTQDVQHKIPGDGVKDDDAKTDMQRQGADSDNTFIPRSVSSANVSKETQVITSSSPMPLSEQSNNITAPPSVVHSFPSMVNPHVTHAIQLDEKRNAVQKLPEKPSQEQKLQAWKNYCKEKAFGQDIIGRLNYVGRSGTPSDVRYVAHDWGEKPEFFTQHILADYARTALGHENPSEGAPLDEQKENMFLQQSLEEFYQTADAFYSGSPHVSKHMRVKSAPSGYNGTGRTNSEAATPLYTGKRAASSKLGHQLQHAQMKEEESKVNDEPEEQKSAVKLNAVVNLIGSVSSDMIYYKEKLVPDAQPGFRQPVLNGLPISNPVVVSSLRLPSPTARSNTPMDEYVPTSTQQSMRPHSSPLRAKEIIIPEEIGVQIQTNTHPQERCKSAGVVDWRGRIQPDTVRYKWTQTKFGGFTYVKKLPHKPLSFRSAGSTSAGKRPRTAPMTVKEKWKTQKPSDQNARVEAQAASNSMTSMNQQTLDSLITVQYLLGTSDSRADSLDLFYFNEDSVHGHSRSCHTPAPAPLEYLSFVRSPIINVDKKPPITTSPVLSKLLARYKLDGPTKSNEAEPNQTASPDEIHLPLVPESPSVEETGPDIDIKAIDARLEKFINWQQEQLQQQRQELQQDQFQQEELTKECEQESTAEQSEVPEQKEAEVQTDAIQTEANATDAINNAGTITQVTSISGNKSPVPPSLRRAPLQHLSKSEVWQFGLSSEGELKSGFMLAPSSAQWTTTKPLAPKEMYCSDCSPSAGAQRVQKLERSAGRTPGLVHSASAQMVHLSRRHAELMRRTPPLRTPPSIPVFQGRSPRTLHSPCHGPMMSELEHHARKIKSPRAFMQHVKDLRNNGSGRTISTAPHPQDMLSGSLQVCRLALPIHRSHTTPASFESEDGLQSLIRQPTDFNFLSNGTEMPGSNETVDSDATGEKVVKFNRLDPKVGPLNQLMTPAYQINGLHTQESLPEIGTTQQTVSGHSSRASSLHGSHRASQHGSDPPMPVSKNLSRIGRPIAQVTHIPDPDEVTKAVQKQKEAAAAVDIQRIFRGYVARNLYKKLLSEERRQLEDIQKAAVEIQRRYRGHLLRKKSIERRPPDAAMMEWAHNYRILLIASEQERLRKKEELSFELSQNHHLAQSKLSVIGPHVNIYEIYHPKKTGPSMKELYRAATCIQRYIRGWLVRRRMDKLHRKAGWYGSTFPKMVKEYKSMLIRVQRQHGASHPQAPFTTKDMNDYLDTRRRYESVFEKKAFGGELELTDVESFFRECDLYPSQTEIDEAMDVVLRGTSAIKTGRGLKRQEMLDIVFYIYTPRASGLENTRQSTWMNPIIDGVEARRLIGSEFIEETPLKVCAELVFKAKREQRERERMAAEKASQEMVETPDDSKAESEQPVVDTEKMQESKKIKKVTVQEPDKGLE